MKVRNKDIHKHFLPFRMAWSDDETRAVLCHKVYKEDGKLIATDGRIITVIDCPDGCELDDGLYCHDGEKSEGKFPNWKQCVPDDSQFIHTKRFHKREVIAIAKGITKGSNGCKRALKLGDDVYFNPAYIRAAIESLEADVFEIKFGGPLDAAVIKSKNGFSVVMPLRIVLGDYENIVEFEGVESLPDPKTIAHETGLELIEILQLKVKKNGRVDTSWGDKTPRGLALTVRRIIHGKRKG